MAKTLLLLLILLANPAMAEIYQWVDEDGQTHFSDSSNKPDNAEKADISAINTVESLPPASLEDQNANSKASKPKPAVMTAASWSQEHCSVRVRILYTERSFIPCVPTDEVPVFICNAEVPRRFSNYFGRRYRYEDRESECGPEVYEGEILYLKK